MRLLVLFPLLPLAWGESSLELRLNSLKSRDGQFIGNAYRSLIPEVRQTKDPELLARTLEDYVEWQVRNGDAHNAAPLLKEALSIGQALKREDLQARAEELSGEVFAAQLEYGLAAQSYDRAQQLWRSAGNVQLAAAAQQRMAQAWGAAGNFAYALRAADSAIGAAEANAEAGWSSEIRWRSLLVKASLLAKLGCTADAVRMLKELATDEGRLEPGRRLDLLLELGTLYQRLGDPLKAQDTLLRGALIADSAHLVEPAMAALRLLGHVEAADLANLHLARGRLEKYRQICDFAGRRVDSVFARLWLGELEFRNGTDDDAEVTWGQARYLARDLRSAEIEWRLLFGAARSAERRANLALAIRLMRQTLQVMNSPRALLEPPSQAPGFAPGRRDVYDALIGLLLASRDEGVEEELLQLTSQARMEAYQTTLKPSASLARQRASYRSLLASRAHATPAERKKIDAQLDAIEGNFAKSQPPNPVLTLSQLQARIPKNVTIVSYWMGPVQLATQWITATSAGHTVQPLGEEECARLRQFLSEAANPGSASLETLSAEVGEMLLNLPPEAANPRLILAPDGLLNSLPFEALAVQGQWALDAYEISYLPALPVERRAPTARLVYPWQKASLWVAAPPARAADLLPPDAHWSSANRPAALLPALQRYLPGVPETAGAQALASVRSPLLHLAVHAAPGDGNAAGSRILMGGYQDVSSLAQRDLSSVELAVFPLSEGDGLLINQALLNAGAGAAISSLWKTDDRASGELLKQFYYFLGRGMSKSAALREAKKKLAGSHSEWAHPAYWASFVLMGDGDAALPRPLSWSSLLLGAAAALLLAGLAGSMLFTPAQAESAQRPTQPTAGPRA